MASGKEASLLGDDLGTEGPDRMKSSKLGCEYSISGNVCGERDGPSQSGWWSTR